MPAPPLDPWTLPGVVALTLRPADDTYQGTHAPCCSLQLSVDGLLLARPLTPGGARAVAIYLATWADCVDPLDPLPPGPSAVPGAHNYIAPDDLRRTDDPHGGTA